jgi:hypothetical protein
MSSATTSDTIRLQRVHYFSRQLLTAADLIADRTYFLEKLRRHNRFLHGWGVVCGLQVIAAPIETAPWRVRVSPGYALGPYGDEIFVGEPVYYDLSSCGAAGATVYLAIRYAYTLTDPAQVSSPGCGCKVDPCQYTRIADTFELSCLSELPAQPSLPATLCQITGGTLAPCPSAPTDPSVILATIQLPSAPASDISGSGVDNVTNRRLILSTSILEDQVTRCCCPPASSSSSSSAVISTSRRPQSHPVFKPTNAILVLGQRATRIGATGQTATQIAITVMNNGAAAADNVIVTAGLSPTLSAADYQLKPAMGWQSATLSALKSGPVTLAAGKAQTFSFQIVPVKRLDQSTITCTASVTASNTEGSASASKLQAIVGG